MKKFLVLIFILIMSNVAFAQDVTLTWDANSDADHYIVYWGDTVDNYTEASNPVKELTYTVLGLKQKPYFFAVKAFNYCGNSSDYSESISSCSILTSVSPMAKPAITIIRSDDGRIIIEIN